MRTLRMFVGRLCGRLRLTLILTLRFVMLAVMVRRRCGLLFSETWRRLLKLASRRVDLLVSGRDACVGWAFYCL